MPVVEEVASCGHVRRQSSYSFASSSPIVPSCPSIFILFYFSYGNYQMSLLNLMLEIVLLSLSHGIHLFTL